MRDFKKGDKVLIAATVLKDGIDGDGDVVIDAEGSDGYGYASPSNCTLIEPDELKVGDRVSVQGCVADGKITACWLDPTKFDVRADDGSWIASAVTADRLTKLPPEPEITEPKPDELKVGDPVKTNSGNETTIKEIATGYRLKDGAVRFPDLYTADQLTRCPPNPEYRVERKNDCLFLMWLPPDKTAWAVHTRVAMDDPGKIANRVEAWPRHYGIDREEIQKLVDKPETIGKRYFYGTGFLARRVATGWYVVSPFAREEGVYVEKNIAQAMFPQIIGPCLDKP